MHYSDPLLVRYSERCELNKNLIFFEMFAVRCLPFLLLRLMLFVYKVIKEDIGKILDELPRTIKIPLQGNGMATTSKKEKLQLTFGLAQNNQNTITGKWHGCHFKKRKITIYFWTGQTGSFIQALSTHLSNN